VDGVEQLLQPVAHALLQAREDAARALSGVTTARLWQRHGAAASAGFHVRHLVGSLDRLLTYARGDTLTEQQRDYLAGEKDTPTPPTQPAELLLEVQAALDRALDQVARTRSATLLDERLVGGRRLPSNVLGLLFHAAEHTTRHVGQLITTLRVSEGGLAGLTDAA
jgi:hypothetical protein